MLTRISKLLILFFLLATASPPFFQNSVEADQLFPSEGYEDQIEFWKLVFAQYGEKDVIFHDSRDLRLIYEVMSFQERAAGNPAEAKRQAAELQRKYDEITGILDDLARSGAAAAQKSDRHGHIARLMEVNGYSLSSAQMNQRKENLRRQRGIKEKFRAGLIRSGRYVDAIQGILQRHGVPRQLAYLPHIESSFEYTAYSKVGAAGIWQFMPGTGRRFLRINSSIDERLDPLKAAEAAARLLSENYQKLGNWPLAITAYNHGTNGMLRAKQAHGSDLRVIIDKYESRIFGFAGRNFYPEFLAAVEIAQDHQAFFGPLAIEPPVQFDTYRVPSTIHVRQVMKTLDMDENSFKRLNPKFTKRFWSGNRTLAAGTEVRIPAGTAQQASRIQGTAPTASAADARSEAAVSAGPGRHRVVSGETLDSIARKYGTTAAALQNTNGIRNRNQIRVGQVLTIPGSGTTAQQAATPQAAETQAASSEPAPPQSRPTRHRVRSGETLDSIAKRYGTTATALQSANNIRNRNRIQVGQALTIPGSAPRNMRAAAVAASAPSSESARTTYQVRARDTLTAIARKFGISVELLQAINGIENPHQIYLGQTLLIP
jgi:membrane-bound lytic murein transglycosylase D